MNQFKDMGIKLEESSVLKGDKIKIKKILGEHITVKAYKIVPSKFTKNGDEKCLYIQIVFEEKDRVLFTGSKILQNFIEKVPKGKFSFWDNYRRN